MGGLVRMSVVEVAGRMIHRRKLSAKALVRFEPHNFRATSRSTFDAVEKGKRCYQWPDTTPALRTVDATGPRQASRQPVCPETPAIDRQCLGIACCMFNCGQMLLLQAPPLQLFNQPRCSSKAQVEAMARGSRGHREQGSITAAARSRHYAWQS